MSDVALDMTHDDVKAAVDVVKCEPGVLQALEHDTFMGGCGIGMVLAWTPS